jgi:CRP-like cAMP-binding protein
MPDEIDHALKQQLLQVFAKIPLFAELTLLQAEKVLSLCRPKEYSAGQVLYEQGTPGTEMCILLSGTLHVVREQVLLATIRPGGSVGETEILTGATRMATVTATVPVKVLRLHRLDLERLMRQDLDLAMLVLRYLSQTLSQRVVESTTRLDEYVHRVETLEARTTELTQQLETYAVRLERVEQAQAGGTPLSGVERETGQQFMERHLAQLQAKAYRRAYEDLSVAAQADVSWAEYERIFMQVEALGGIRQVRQERFAPEYDEHRQLRRYQITYAVEFASARGRLELTVQQEHDGWKISEERLTVTGGAPTKRGDVARGTGA